MGMGSPIEIDLNDIARRKAGRGRQIVHTTERYKNCNDNLADVLLDLMMYAAADGKDFEKELETARRWFKQDTAPPATVVNPDYVRDEFINTTGVGLQRLVKVDIEALCARFGAPGLAGEFEKGYENEYRFRSPWGDPVTLYDWYGAWRVGAKNPDQADLFLKWLGENKLAEGR